MAAPPKPWERKCVSQNTLGFTVDQTPGGQYVNQRTTTSMPPTNRNFQSASMQRMPPPLPTRPSQQSSLASSSPLSRYGYSGYGGMGMGSYGGMYGNYGGMYSSYGGGMYGGYGQRPFGMAGGNEPFSRFVQQAEESSRPAFQSIESIVQAFASVSMMLESTFHTVYNSFRAVLGVAEHFSRLKIHLAKIFSAIAIFRFLRYIYRKLLVLVGLRSQEFAEEIWLEAESQAAEGALAIMPPGKQKKSPSWPIFMFFAVVVGGPYIIWKLLSSNEEDSESTPEWASGEEDHVVARAEYDFDGEGDKELSFHSGDIINVAPKELQPRVRGWLLASSGGNKIGLVPANYVKILGKRRGRKYAQTEQQQNPITLTQSSQELSRSGQSSSASGGLQSSKSIPSKLGNVQGGASNFSDVFASSNDADRQFVDGVSSEMETDFVFSSENANNSNSVFGSGIQQDFTGFDDAHWPGPGIVEHNPEGKAGS